RPSDGAVFLEPSVKGDDVENIQMLPLVFMNTLRLYIEKGVRVDDDARPLLDQFGEVCLIGLLHFPPSSPEFRVLNERLEPGNLLFEPRNPLVAYGLAYESRKARVAQCDPPPGRDPVGDVVKLLRPNLVEI